MPDRYVPIQSATLKMNSAGELATTGAGGGGGGTTADTGTTTNLTYSNQTPTLLLPANPDRKGFSIYAITSQTHILFGGVDSEGVPIPNGQPGAIGTGNFTTILGAGTSAGFFYESGPTVYTGAITVFNVNSSGIPVVHVTELT